MVFDLDIILLISSFVAIFFTFVFLANKYDLITLCTFDNTKESKSKTYYVKYTIFNKLSTINYDTYNKFQLWLYVVEF